MLRRTESSMHFCRGRRRDSRGMRLRATAILASASEKCCAKANSTIVKSKSNCGHCPSALKSWRPGNGGDDAAIAGHVPEPGGRPKPAAQTQDQGGAETPGRRGGGKNGQ